MMTKYNHNASKVTQYTLIIAVHDSVELASISWRSGAVRSLWSGGCRRSWQMQGRLGFVTRLWKKKHH